MAARAAGVSLQWRPAEKIHTPALHQFVCADPASRTYDKHRGPWHPKPWEMEVQCHLRGRRPPLANDEALILGLNSAGIAAAVHFGFDDDAEHFIIFAVGRATRCAGLGYGAEAVQVALDVCRSTRSRYGLDNAVFTRIDPRNDPSRKAFANLGFEFLGVYEGYEGWVHDLTS